MSVPYVFVSYLRHLIAPFHLSLIYGTSFISGASDLRFLLPAVLIFALAAFLWTYRKKISSEAWVAIALIVVPLIPVLNLKVFHYEYIIQDRYLYLPSIGFCYLIGLGLYRIGRERRQIALIVGCLLVLAFGVSTVFQNRVWNSSIALWQRAVDYSPNSWSTHYNLGLAYLGQKQYEPARKELLEARRLNPNQASVYNNLALAQKGLGDNENALANLKSALALDSRSFESHNNLGTFLFENGDYTGAKREFSLVLERDPASDSARFNLARTLAATGDHAAAIREFEAVLARHPDDAEARYQLGLSYAAAGRKGDAVREIQRALAYPQTAETIRQMQQKLAEIQSEK
jgi:tetratricopeptide (TPR) repeat protein